MKKMTRSITIVLMAIMILLGVFTATALDYLTTPDLEGWYQSGEFPNTRYGFRDMTGAVLLSPSFDFLMELPDGFAAVGLSGKFGFVDPWGQVIIPLVYDQVAEYINNLVMVGAVDDSGLLKWGVVDVKAGAEIAALQYSEEELLLIKHLLSPPGGVTIPANVEHLHWDDVKKIFPLRTPVKVFDIESGITYYVSNLSNNIHADVEPVTAQDNALLLQSTGGRPTWYGNPIWVTLGDRTIAATVHSFAHDISTIRDNDMDGHVCMHFRGSFTSNVGVHTHNQNMAALAYRAFEIYSGIVAGRDWSPTTPEPEPEPEPEPIPPLEPATATLSDAALLVDGERIDIAAYLINGNNYFRLRDVADALNGTAAQFNLEWDSEYKAILLVSNSPYTGTGDMLGATAETAHATPTASTVLLDYNEVFPRAYFISGNNYFMLRDIASMLGFTVDWDGETRTISVNT